jgi:5'-3' exonuclease
VDIVSSVTNKTINQLGPVHPLKSKNKSKNTYSNTAISIEMLLRQIKISEPKRSNLLVEDSISNNVTIWGVGLALMVALTFQMGDSLDRIHDCQVPEFTDGSVNYKHKMLLNSKLPAIRFFVKSH